MNNRIILFTSLWILRFVDINTVICFIFRHLQLHILIVKSKIKYFLDIHIIILPFCFCLLWKHQCHKIPLMWQFLHLTILFYTMLCTHQCRQLQQWLRVYNNCLCIKIKAKMLIHITHNSYFNIIIERRQCVFLHSIIHYDFGFDFI